MAVSVKKISLWRREVDNKPGILAGVLGPLAEAGADLQVVMGYRYPGNESKAAIEVYPVSGKRVTKTAHESGLSVSATPTLLVIGDNKPGLGRVIAEVLAEAGINLGFLVTQVVGRRYSAVIGFGSEADLGRAATMIKKATASKRK
jgi:hypothetical protein